MQKALSSSFSIENWRDELRNKELLQAIEQSKRSFEEIIDFLNTDDSQD